MLAPNVGRSWTYEELKEATPELFKAAASREGEWVVHRPFYRGWGWTPKWTKVVFTEKEFTSLYHILEHGLSTQAKASALKGSLVMEAKRLWPTGSLEHMAMKQVGVSAMNSMAQGHSVEGCCGYLDFLISMGCMPEEVRTHYRRLAPGKAKVPAEEDTAGAPSGSGVTEPGPPSGSEPKPEPGPGQTVPPPGLGKDEKETALTSTGKTARDLEVLQNADDTLRYIKEDGMVKVLGREYDTSTDSYPVAGIQTGPCSEEPLVYCNTFENVTAAVHHRLELKAKPCTWTKDDKAKYLSFARAACHGKHAVFSRDRVQKWIVDNWDFEKIKSGKWSMNRMQISLQNLMRQHDPQFRLAAAIKAEVMPTGKAPRLLIADGDDGQLMALMTVKCFEDILFEHFEKKSIKHLPKREAVDRCVRELQAPAKLKEDSGAIEGDGSAWDTTCNPEVRSSENYILYHIVEMLSDLGACPKAWHDAHTAINEKKQLKIFFRGACGNVVKKINAIRRSGHRGTSCLNWWTNYAMWYCSVFHSPHLFLDPAVRKGIDVLGVIRWFNGCFEGDDSLVKSSPKLLKGTDITNAILGYWERAGFNMKFVFVENRATFVGWHVAAQDGKLVPGDIAPELPRALKNNVSCSPLAKEAAAEGDLFKAKMVAAAAMLARAADFSGLMPTVSRKYQQYAITLAARDSTVTDRELTMRITGDDKDELTFATVHDRIDEANLGRDPVEETRLLDALGLSVTHDELQLFESHLWAWDSLDDYEGFAASVPQSWQ